MGLITTKELAEILGVSVGTIYKMVISGRIPSVKVGKGRNMRFDPEGVKEALGTESPGVIEVTEDPLFTIHELAIDTGISDLAQNHDYYLYGIPKR